MFAAPILHFLRVGEAETVEQTARVVRSYEPFRKLLGTPHVEHVSVLFNDKPAHMFVDELGHRKGLPRNEAATAIYRAWWLKHHPDDPETISWIAGDAIVLENVVIR